MKTGSQADKKGVRAPFTPSELDTKDRKGDAELFLGGKKAGEVADHPMNTIVYKF